jgi:hypothetical protein
MFCFCAPTRTVRPARVKNRSKMDTPGHFPGRRKCFPEQGAVFLEPARRADQMHQPRTERPCPGQFLAKAAPSRVGSEKGPRKPRCSGPSPRNWASERFFPGRGMPRQRKAMLVLGRVGERSGQQGSLLRPRRDLGQRCRSDRRMRTAGSSSDQALLGMCRLAGRTKSKVVDSYARNLGRSLRSRLWDQMKKMTLARPWSMSMLLLR